MRPFAAKTCRTIAAIQAIAVAAPSWATAVVLANRTPEAVQLNTIVDDGPVRPLTLAPGDCRPLFANASARIRVPQPTGPAQDIALEPNAAYYVGVRPNDGSLALRKIGLGESGPLPWKPLAKPPLETVDAGVISVKILVDEDELRPRQVWEPVLRERIDKASAILDAHCGIRLRVTAIDSWNSDSLITDFDRSLAEFEGEVKPSPATVAIGFSSQYAIAKGRVHLGGTRGPLHSHILIKERSINVLEPERLELLVHELGHFLGATHSPEATSVMRPVIAQGKQRAAGARYQFDPPNTLLMSLLAQEVRQRRVRELSAVSEQTRRRMGQIYVAINPTLPKDPAAQHYARLMASAGAEPLIEDTRRVLAEIVRVAEVRKQVSQRTPKTDQSRATMRLSGDQLLEFYVRQGALAAKQVRRENGPKALVLALGIAFDDSGMLAKLPVARKVMPYFEGEQQRPGRIAAIGQPTMRGRPDLAKHFFVSSHLVALAGSEMARSAGLMKEIADAHGGTGFSFADMLADRAGVVFAQALLSGRVTLDEVAQHFTVNAYLPPITDLREGMNAQQFEKEFGSFDGDGLRAELDKLEARITALPVYQTPPTPAR